MLSICIPIFNEDVTRLVNELHRQCNECDLEFEILLGDDSSSEASKEINRPLSELESVELLEFEDNVGYTKNRNRLVEVSRFDHLLFLDADMRIENDDYLRLMLEAIGKAEVICGGLLYENQAPENPDLLLKWMHGKQYEERDVAFRQKHPFVSFTAANFLISKKLIQQIPLDSTSLGYGYNDTMYGYRLMREGKSILHVDNPVYHDGLIGKEKFLSRAKESAMNLVNFEKQEYVEKDSFFAFIKLLRVFVKLKKFKLAKLVYHVLKLRMPAMLENLKSDAPKLTYLSLVKLYYYLELKVNA